MDVERIPAFSREGKQIRAGFTREGDASGITVDEMRQAWEDGVRQNGVPDGTEIESYDADGVYCEKISCAADRTDGVILWEHGGGYNSGSCLTHRHWAARMACAARISVLLFNYRRAPEDPFPAALEDTLRVYRWLLARGTSPRRIVVGGDSAGGGLAVSLLLALKANAEPLPAAGVLISPWLDLTQSGESYKTRADLDLLCSYENLLIAAQRYAGEGDARNPLVSPLFGDLRGLPAMLVQVGDHEVLLSDSVGFADRASHAGVDVQVQVWEEMWHVFPAWAADVPEGRMALKHIGEFARTMLAVPVSN